MPAKVASLEQDREKESFKLPNKIPLIKTTIPGEKSKKILAEQAELETGTVIYPKSFPIAIKRAQDSVIEDVDGNFFIDWFTGICVLNLGTVTLFEEQFQSNLAKSGIHWRFQPKLESSS